MFLIPSPSRLWTFSSIIPIFLLHFSTSLSSQLITYIVHMDPSAMPTPFSDHLTWYTSTLTATTSATVSTSSILYTYTNALHGFSAQLTTHQLQLLQSSRGFISAYPDRLIRPDTTRSPSFLGLADSDGLPPAANEGEGVIIGMVDTGIWPESASFSEDNVSPPPSRWRGACDPGTDFPSAACNRKLIGARFFNKALLASNPNASTAVNSTRDTDGHGTHTASTAAGNYVSGASFFGYANGTARGVAPRAHIAAYKVLWEEGGYAADVIAGIDQAVADGVDVLSISLGVDGAPLHKDPVAIAAFGAVSKGIFVATSTGNAGPALRSLHNGIPWTLTIGASTIDRQFSGVIELGDGNSINGTALYIGSTPPPERAPLVKTESCNDSGKLQNVEGKIVVCNSIKSLEDAIDIVKRSDRAGGIFITDDIFSEFYEIMSFPGVIVTPQQGDVLLNYMKRAEANATATLRFHETILGSKPAPEVVAYTSRGPSSSCPTVLKPDVVAPGSLILASWARNLSVAVVGGKPIFDAYNVISGSSMACPHAAGIAALLRAVYPNWSPAAIRSAIMTTADFVDNTGEPIKDIGSGGIAASPLGMGAGHVNPNRALDPGLVYDAGVEDYVRLLCAMNYTKKEIHTIIKTSDFNCTYASLDLNYPSFVAFFNGTRAVREFRRTVTKVGEGSCSYVAELEQIDGLTITVTPVRLVFGNKDERQNFVVRVEGSIREVVLHGALTWVEEAGKHRVRSPIVATTLSAEPL